MAFGIDLSVIAMIGIILLIGIVKKNGIMMVDFAIEAERHRGLAPERGDPQACILRFRPIMMTTMAALLGGVPLMLGNGTGSEIRQPLGYAMVGGLMRQPGADALHDAGGLSLSRPRQSMAEPAPGWPRARRGAGGCRVRAPASRSISAFCLRDSGEDGIQSNKRDWRPLNPGFRRPRLRPRSTSIGRSMCLRRPLLQLADARQEQSENWRRVGLVVADDEIDRRCLAIERTGGHGRRQEILRIGGQKGHAFGRCDQ